MNHTGPDQQLAKHAREQLVAGEAPVIRESLRQGDESVRMAYPIVSFMLRQSPKEPIVIEQTVAEQHAAEIRYLAQLRARQNLENARQYADDFNLNSAEPGVPIDFGRMKIELDQQERQQQIDLSTMPIEYHYPDEDRLAA